MPDAKKKIHRETIGGLAGSVIAGLFGGNRRVGAVLGQLAAKVTSSDAQEKIKKILGRK